MKTFTSFFALFAARRSFTVVVRPRVNLPGLTVPGPSNSLPQRSGVPLSYQAKRHLAATSAMVQRDDEEGDVTCCYPQPSGSIFYLPYKLLDRGFYKRGLSSLSLQPMEGFEKFV